MERKKRERLAEKVENQVEKAEASLEEVNAESPQAEAIRSNLELSKVLAEALNLDIGGQ